MTKSPCYSRVYWVLSNLVCVCIMECCDCVFWANVVVKWKRGQWGNHPVCVGCCVAWSVGIMDCSIHWMAVRSRHCYILIQLGNAHFEEIEIHFKKIRKIQFVKCTVFHSLALGCCMLHFETLGPMHIFKAREMDLLIHWFNVRWLQWCIVCSQHL